jgi:hypothetical protein
MTFVRHRLALASHYAKMYTRHGARWVYRKAWGQSPGQDSDAKS